MLRKTIKRQTRQVFRTLLAALKNAPDAEFAFPFHHWEDAIGGVARHIGSCIQWTFPNEEIIETWEDAVVDKESCIAFVESCRELMLDYVGDNDLLEADHQPEFFASKLDRVMKLLRHTAQHTGEINSILKSLGLERGPFI